MTPFMSLLLPIIFAAIAVFLLSAVLHMALPWHKRDYTAVPNEEAALAALGSLAIPPGDYNVPGPIRPDGSRNPDFMPRLKSGPLYLMTVTKPNAFNMGNTLGVWFCVTVLVAAIAACAAGSIVAPGGDGHDIFHIAGGATFLAYSFGEWPLAIWYHRKWSTVLRNTVDALLYGAATGLIFVWMWPKS